MRKVKIRKLDTKPTAQRKFPYIRIKMRPGNILHSLHFTLLPAEKGGLRTADVSPCVCVCVCLCQFWFSIEFQHGYGLIHTEVCAHSDWPIREQGTMYGPIQTDQSGSREGLCGHKLTNQREGRVCVKKQADQSEFLDNFTMQGYERRVTIGDMSVCLLFQ